MSIEANGGNFTFNSVGFKLTGACEYRCPFCCEPDRLQATYPVSNFLKISDIMREHGTQRLCLTGGDPLLYTDLNILLSHTKDLGFENVLLTANGRLLESKIDTISNYVDAVRFSVHGIGSNHDKTVGSDGSFGNIESAVAIVNRLNIACFAATVVTKDTAVYLRDILKWCHSKEVTQLFIFELMKSGAGKKFIEDYGIVGGEMLRDSIESLRTSEYASKVKIVHYDYKDKGDCVLIYGNGDVYIDPYPDSETYQLFIGNILNDGLGSILRRFSKDPANLDGYIKHHRKYI